MASQMSFATTTGTRQTKAMGATLGTITPAVGIRSSCGNQVKSTVHSHPSYGFGESCFSAFPRVQHIMPYDLEACC